MGLCFKPLRGIHCRHPKNKNTHKNTHVVTIELGSFLCFSSYSVLTVCFFANKHFLFKLETSFSMGFKGLCHWWRLTGSFDLKRVSCCMLATRWLNYSELSFGCPAINVNPVNYIFSRSPKSPGWLANSAFQCTLKASFSFHRVRAVSTNICCEEGQMHLAGIWMLIHPLTSPTTLLQVRYQCIYFFTIKKLDIHLFHLIYIQGFFPFFPKDLLIVK